MRLSDGLPYREALQRPMYNFPSGPPGIGLLVLRLALAGSLVLDGVRILNGLAEFAGFAAGLVVGFLLVLCAALVVLGFLTEVVQTIVVLVLVLGISQQTLWVGDISRGSLLLNL